MSTVFLHVGQCGNQLGQSFWQEVEEWTARNAKEASRPSSHSTPSRSRNRSGGGSAATAPGSESPSTSTYQSKYTYLPYSLVNGTLPCLCVDTEPKAIRTCVNSRRTSLKKRFASDCNIVLPERSGRGSNWAYGYNGRARGSTSLAGTDGSHSTVKSVEEKMRKVVEKCDRFSGTILMHSLAGGTGSGTD